MLQHNKARIMEVINLVLREKKIGFESMRGEMLMKKNEIQKWVVGFQEQRNIFRYYHLINS